MSNYLSTIRREALAAKDREIESLRARLSERFDPSTTDAECDPSTARSVDQIRADLAKAEELSYRFGDMFLRDMVNARLAADVGPSLDALAAKDAEIERLSRRNSELLADCDACVGCECPTLSPDGFCARCKLSDLEADLDAALRRIEAARAVCAEAEVASRQAWDNNVTSGSLEGPFPGYFAVSGQSLVAALDAQPGPDGETR